MTLGTTVEPAEPAVGIELAQVLELLRHNVTGILSAVSAPPSGLRVRAGAVSVELEWPAGDRGGAAPVTVVAAPTTAVATVTAPPVAAVAASPAPPPPGGDGAGQHAVVSPSVGTFYRAPEPGAKPFVEVGDQVEVGQQVGIIEVMKLMIPVEADRRGTVTEVARPDASPVEYGEPLIIISVAGAS